MQIVVQRLNRRKFLRASLAGASAAAATAAPQPLASEETDQAKPPAMRLASFRFDVTPPKGHSLCGGWIAPAEGVDDPLEAIGLVLLGAGLPIVLCAVDWTGLLNDAHAQWRETLADACDTTPDRVAVHCVHQHNAPFACLGAEAIVAAEGDLPHIVDTGFFNQCLARAYHAAHVALPNARRITHVAFGQAKVREVASNRRVDIGPDGLIRSMRGSSCKDERLRSLPEGLIDAHLKTVAFFDDDTKIAACHYYATHPMSYYGDGRVSSDFVGLARKLRQQEEPETTHVYFTGCAGNIAAGKYNDGSKEMRPVLARRIYDAIVASEAALRREPITDIRWTTLPILPPPRSGVSAETLAAQIHDRQNAVDERNRPSFQLAWIQRLQRKSPILLSALHVGSASMLHLPAEVFVEYQLRAQEMKPDRFVAAAAYGDGGPWYVPTQEAYPQGGYEVSVAFCDPPVDWMLTHGIRKLLDDA